MRKQIKKYGNTAVIVFTKEDLDGYNLEIGDYIDLSDITKIVYKKLPKNQTAKQIKEHLQ